jgi:hypothetical protein
LRALHADAHADGVPVAHLDAHPNRNPHPHANCDAHADALSAAADSYASASELDR